MAKGRPSTFKQETADEICFSIIDGLSLRAICQLPGMPPLRTLMGWVESNEVFQQQYTRARQMQADIKFDDLKDLAKTANPDNVQCVKLQIDTTTPSATVDISAGAVDIDGDVAGTSYQTINTTGVFTPVTAGYVKEANAFAVQPTQLLAPIGDIVFNSSAARAGVIKWYLRYVPLSPNSRVVAAA